MRSHSKVPHGKKALLLPGLAFSLCLVAAVLVVKNLRTQGNEIPESVADYPRKPQLRTTSVTAANENSGGSDPLLQGALPRRKETRPSLEEASLPDGTSMTSEEFRSERSRLMREQRELHRQLASTSPEERHEAMEKWHDENAATLSAQQEFAARMAAGGDSPEERRIHAARQAAANERMEIMNELRDAPPEERSKALRAWREKHGPVLAVGHPMNPKP
jgi:hypothetical protein